MDPWEALFTRGVARGMKKDENDFLSVLEANTLIHGDVPDEKTRRDLFFLNSVGFFDKEKKDDER